MMSKFTSFLNKLTSAKTSFTNGDAASASAGSMLYVAKSGGINDSEFDMLVDMMRSNPRFAGLDVDALIGHWEGYKSDRMLRRDLMNLLSKVRAESGKELAEDVLISSIEVADAEDGIDDEEEKLLAEIAKQLGLKLEDYM